MNTIGNNIYENLKLLPEDLQGWNGNDPIFGELIKEINPSVIIEVGSWKGQSAVTMGKAIQEQNLNTILYCVDTWLGAVEFWDQFADTPERDLMLVNGYPQIYYQFLSNVVHNNLQDVIIPFPNTSKTGAEYFKRRHIRADLIYIDASHEYNDVLEDITLYWDILNNGGILFGDDYSTWTGVRDAVNKFVGDNNLTLGGNGVHWVIKK